MKKITFFLVSSVCLFTQAQTGILDPGFGTGGFILTPPSSNSPGSASSAHQCFVRTDGKIDMILLGAKTEISRRLPNGQLDTTYGHRGFSEVASMIGTCAAVQADEKIVVAGTTNGSADFMLVRYQTNGTLDSSFGNSGVVITDIGSPLDFLNAVTITPDGKIIAGGSSQFGGQEDFVLVQYASSGSIDGSFGTNGVVITNFSNAASSVSSLALQADGKIVAAGTVYSNFSDFAVARYNGDGSLDLTFNSNGKVSSDFGFGDVGESVVIDPNDKIYVGGFSSDASGFQHFRITRYNSDGSADQSYNGGSVLAIFGDSYDVLINIFLQRDGKILAAGHTNLNSSNDIELIRINADGTMDNNFGSMGNGLVLGDFNGYYDESTFLTIEPDGKILTGGSSQDFGNSVPSFVFTCFRFNVDGTPDMSFGTNGSFGEAIPYGYNSYLSLFLQNDGKLLAAGITNSGATNEGFLRRFNANGTTDSTFAENGVKNFGQSSGSFYFQNDGKLLSVNYIDANTITLSRYNADGSPDISFGSGGTAPTLYGGFPAFQQDGKIVLGGFTTTGDNSTDFAIARYNSDGSLDQSFGSGGYSIFDVDNIDNLNSISIAPDGKIIVGGTGYVFPPDFSFFLFDAVVARLNPDGSLDTGFGDNGKVKVYHGSNDFMGMARAQNDNKILLTYYLSPDNIHQDIFLQRLNADGTIDNSFGQNGQTTIDGGLFSLQADQKILVLGSRTNEQNNLDFTLARFNNDGSVDQSFGNNGKTISSFTGIDNVLITSFISANVLFAGGNGIDRTGLNTAIIAKYRLDAGNPLTCPADKIVNTDNNLCAAHVYDIDPIFSVEGQTVKYSLTGATTGSGEGSVSGQSFNKGITNVTYSLASDTTRSCRFTVTVEDNQAPAINNLTATPNILFPPNHKLKDVAVDYSLSDNCGIANVQLSVSSNEPVQTNEKDDQSPDWQIIDNHHIRLRAERLETGNGRVYTLKLTVTDESGNQSIATTTVNVPKSEPSDGNLILAASPNPSHNYFEVTVKSARSEKITIRLLNNEGTVITTIPNVESSQILRLGDGLYPGIYFVEANQSGVTKTLRLVMQ